MKQRTQPPWNLVMAYLDGQMPPKRQQAFEKYLAQHPEWADQIAEISAVVEATGRLRVKPPDPHVWDNYWEEIDARLPRHVGWMASLIGAIILLTFGIWKILIFAENDYVRFGILLVLGGIAILFALVVRGRLMEIPRDRYRRINK